MWGNLAPTGPNGVGNVSTAVGSYYALTTDMTLEEYEAHVQSIFEGEDCGCEHDKEEKTKKEIKARGGPPGYPDKSKKTTKEDVVHELEQRLVTLGSSDWIVVDQVLREMARELDVAPITLSREFRSIHGVYPDKWIKEHLDLEVCGYMPLEEAVRLNKVGKVYEVTFMFRGGTNRLKFFWPHPGDASKEQMQYEVEKFWPKGRVLAFYPTIDNDQNSNYMVMAPPMTENYHFMQPEDWSEVSEEVSEVFEMICEEEGEPISPLMNEDGGYSVVIEDHDTGEQRQVNFSEEGLRDWFGKSSSKDGKKGWVNVVTGGTCASDEPGEGVPKCVSSSKRASMSKDERKASAAKKRRDDPGQQSKSGAAKPTNVKTDVKEEVLEEGKKDACYNKVKSRYSVWPSAYASGALVKCRKKGAKNWGNSSKKEEFIPEVDESIDEACWKGYTKKGMKTMFGKKYPNCVKKEEVVCPVCGFDPCQCLEGSINEDAEQLDELSGKFLRDASSKANEERRKAHRDGDSARADDKQAQSKRLFRAAQDKKRREMNEDEVLESMKDLMTEGGIKSGHKRPTDQGAGLTQKGVDAENAKTGGNLQTAVTTPPSKLKAGSKAAGRRKSFCARSRSWDGERGKAARRRWNC